MYWADLLRSLSGKSASAKREVNVPAEWNLSALSVEAAIRFDDQGVTLSLSGPDQSPLPLNLTETTTHDIAFSALMKALGDAHGKTDALAGLTRIEIDGTLLAASVDACVGVGRETTGAAVFHVVLEAVSKLKEIPGHDSFYERWITREAQAPIDWQSGMLPKACRDRLLSIELEIS